MASPWLSIALAIAAPIALALTILTAQSPRGVP